MIIQNLKAEYGDAFVIKTTADGKPYTIVVDGGPESSCKAIADYYAKLGFINLMILTHYDEDHAHGGPHHARRCQIGRASCRERV